MKNVIKLICCHYKNNIPKNCSKKVLTDLLQYHKDSEEKLRNAKEDFDNYVNGIIKINNISAVLQLDSRSIEFEIDTSNFYNNNNDNLSECKYDPRSCTTQFSHAINRIYKINDEFKQLKLNYEQINTLIKNLERYHHDQSGSNDIYCKFGIDRSGQLMCMVYNFNALLTSSSIIYVYYGSKSSTTMLINYDAYRELYISNFRSVIPRQGYGSFILTELPIIVQEINNLIKKGRYTAIPDTDTITHITGSISPDGTISQQDLINLYNKYGYISKNKLYKKV
ncbi:hypothetical protein P4T48_13450 [Bacillus paramycoides]|uniref:hypothetical protein n=1 Tax=Bacillus paramycoides TaxID=2026194 RepID=UPI002E1CEB93|nr:hypothetical protein [Bacillus paramycoides]